MNYNRAAITNKIKSSAGLSVVELLIAFALLSIVLALAYSYFSFGQNVFKRGEQRADLQQNARLAADFVSEKVRIAERMYLVSEAAWPGLKMELAAEDDGSDQFLFYQIYLENDQIIYKEGLELNDPQTILLESISGQVDFDLGFDLGEKKNILQFHVTTQDHRSGDIFNLGSEVLILNLAAIEDYTVGSTSSRVVYQIPAPLGPMILGITVSPPSISFEDSALPSSLTITMTARAMANYDFRITGSFDKIAGGAQTYLYNIEPGIEPSVRNNDSEPEVIIFNISLDNGDYVLTGGDEFMLELIVEVSEDGVYEPFTRFSWYYLIYEEVVIP